MISTPALPPVSADALATVTSSDLVATLEHETIEPGRQRACTLDEADAWNAAFAPATNAATASSGEIGAALAAAAEAQTGDLVVYTDGYRQLSYPMGDVSALYGVCTDVVIRAYRAVGVDLQQAVKRAGIGSGDESIDHRRTDVLRRFFARAGASIPPTDIAEDYLPGDIVTYHRPQNSGSQSHIAVVSNRLSRAGRPMIVHNRGWGPQIEDALFVDRITGHYRYAGADNSASAIQVASGKSAEPAARNLIRIRVARAKWRNMRAAKSGQPKRTSLR